MTAWGCRRLAARAPRPAAGSCLRCPQQQSTPGPPRWPTVRQPPGTGRGFAAPPATSVTVRAQSPTGSPLPNRQRPSRGSPPRSAQPQPTAKPTAAGNTPTTHSRVARQGGPERWREHNRKTTPRHTVGVATPRVLPTHGDARGTHIAEAADCTSRPWWSPPAVRLMWGVGPTAVGCLPLPALRHEGPPRGETRPVVGQPHHSWHAPRAGHCWCGRGPDPARRARVRNRPAGADCCRLPRPSGSWLSAAVRGVVGCSRRCWGHRGALPRCAMCALWAACPIWGCCTLWVLGVFDRSRAV